MITIGKHTFEDEAARAADYRRRVGPMQPMYTVGRNQTKNYCEWAKWLLAQYLNR